MDRRKIAVIGGGPAGLMAAETLARAGLAVTVCERMASLGRKFLLAGRGGLNFTHSEPLPAFLERYGTIDPRLRAAIEAFPPASLRAWCEDLGQPTFAGSSGRVFPKAMKASPLLRAWLRRLVELGVRFETGQRWTGWAPDGALTFQSSNGTEIHVRADATILALGGASWPRLGSDGGWVPILAASGAAITPLMAANCGVRIEWSAYFRERFAGEPLKRIVIGVSGSIARGEAMITADGLEGGAVYSLGPAIRSALAAGEKCQLILDLKPDQDLLGITGRLSRARRKLSLSNYLRKVVALSPAAIALLHEGHGKFLPAEPGALAAAIRSVPLAITGLGGIERAISTAGGVAWSAIDDRFMLKAMPGTFAAGEMLDWEAPTGGYLLQACFATGVAAARGAMTYLECNTAPPDGRANSE